MNRDELEAQVAPHEALRGRLRVCHCAVITACKRGHHDRSA
jgi:hypothetical protein